MSGPGGGGRLSHPSTELAQIWHLGSSIVWGVSVAGRCCLGDCLCSGEAEAYRADAVLLGGRKLELEKKMERRTTWHLWGPAPESV